MSYATVGQLTATHPEWLESKNLTDVLTVEMVAVYSRRHPNTVLTAMKNGSLAAGRTCRNGTWHTYLYDVQRWIRGWPPVRPEMHAPLRRTS